MENATTIDTAADGEELQAEVSARSAIPADELDRLTTDIVGALKTVYDPEIPCDIYELGLIYKVDIEDDRSINIDMTLTAPGCPVAGEMPGWVENAVASVAGVGPVNVDMVFDPPGHRTGCPTKPRSRSTGIEARGFFPIS